MALDDIPAVQIDESGGHKYIVAEVTDKATGLSKLVVRANAGCGYHSEIFELLKQELRQDPQLSVSCIGGGYIRIDPSVKTINIYASSGSYGRERDRSVTEQMLRGAHPSFRVAATR